MPDAVRRPLLVFLFVTVGVLSWGTAGLFAWFSYDVTMRLPGKAALTGLGDMAQSTVIFDAAEKPVFTIFKEQRIEIPFDEMSPNLRKAVVAVEDQRFYEHGGVDIVRIAAALLNNIREGRRAEGGSTITQQLARQSFLTRDKTVRRKLKEVVLASRILGGTARRGGMPRYKYVSNRALTAFQNLLLGSKLSEFHTGYRAYRREVLERLALLANSDDFVFDNQVIAQALAAGFAVGEISCPTRYFAEASSIDFRRSLVYGLGCLRTSVEFRLWRLGLLRPRRFSEAPGLRLPPAPLTRT